ncbi:MAG: PD-(D/E)XK nuclease family protein [Clostridia bacterium]|nr:PD-(D/E)XK nuclease family protein [Clostridia bacterium]
MVEVKLQEEVNSRFNYIIDKLKTELENDNDRKIFVIVPDQFNFACQKLILDSFSSNVISQIEVQSFTRLIYRIYEEVNYFKEGISNIERLSLISNIVKDKKSQLKFFGKYKVTDKIIIEINNLLNLINKNVIDVTKLKEFKDDNEVILTNKINDIALIYEEYAKKMLEINCDIDVITPLKKIIADCKMIPNSSVYVSEFYNFTNEQLEILRILEKNDSKITLVMQADENYKEYDKGIFSPIRNILEKMQIADANIEYLNVESKKNDELIDLKNIFMDKEIKSTKLENITLNSYTSKDKEIFNVCLYINDLVKKGYRYKDISVAVKNLDNYELKIHNYFDAFNIPYYAENKKKLANSKIVRTMFKVFDMINSNYHIDNVISLIKENLFTRLDDEAIYNFDNYALKTGIEYFDTLYKHYDKEMKDSDKVKREKCNMKKVKEVFDFINDIKTLYGFKTNEPYEVININESNMKLLTDFVDPMFIDIEDKETEKIVNVFEKWNKCETDKFTIDEYILKLKILIEDISVSRVDESIDMVYIYDSQRVNFLKTKVLILCGYSNAQNMKSKLTNLFSEKESEKLNSCDIEFNKRFKDQILEERFLFFNMIEKAQEKLMINYTMFENDSKVEIANELLNITTSFDDMLNGVSFNDDYIIDELLNTDEAIIKYVYLNINEFEVKKELIKKCLINIKNKSLLNELLDYSKNDDVVITDDLEVLELSFSAIRKYIECPFSYFIQYKLGVKERDEMKYDAAKVGNIAHELFEKFFNKLADNTLDAKTLTKEDIIGQVDEIIDNDIETDYLHDEKNELTLKRYKEILSRNLINFVTQINNGDFNVKYNELEFGKDAEVSGIEFDSKDGVKVYLGGKIDRVDTYEVDNEIYLRVIDYKTGKDKFNVKDALKGKNMQLIIYLKVLLDKYKKEGINAVPAGIFLARINKENNEEREYALEDNKLDGLYSDEERIQLMLDRDYRHSDIIDIKFNKDGSLDKSSRNKIRSQEGFLELTNSCVDKTKEITEEILSGIMNVPKEKNEKEMHCDTCPYRYMCSRDE